MIKKTRLDDDAIIYQHAKKQTEIEKLKEMTFKEKKAYIIEYYGFIILGSAFGLALVIYFIYSILRPMPETSLYIAAINYVFTAEKEYISTVEEYLDIDSANQQVVLDSTIYISNQTTDSQTIANEQKLTTYIFAGQIDVFMSDTDTFNFYKDQSLFLDLSNSLTPQLYKELEPFIIYGTDENGNTYPCGVNVNKNMHLKELGSSIEDGVIAILGNAKNLENALRYIEYFCLY